MNITYITAGCIKKYAQVCIFSQLTTLRILRHDFFITILYNVIERMVVYELDTESVESHSICRK